jgi:hypothetical protein
MHSPGAGLIVGALLGAVVALVWQMVAWVVFMLGARALDAQGSPGFFLFIAVVMIAPFSAVCGGLVGWLAAIGDSAVVLRWAAAAAAGGTLVAFVWFGATGQLVTIQPYDGIFWRVVGHASGTRAIGFASSRSVPFVAFASAVAGAAAATLAVRTVRRLPR